jgi:hypothetical protein
MCTLSKLKSDIKKIQTELLTKVQLELLWCDYLKLVDELNELIDYQGKNLFSAQFKGIAASITINLNKQQWMTDEMVYHNNLRSELSRLINLHEEFYNATNV